MLSLIFDQISPALIFGSQLSKLEAMRFPKTWVLMILVGIHKFTELALCIEKDFWSLPIAHAFSMLIIMQHGQRFYKKGIGVGTVCHRY